jgi:transposase-like protein
MRRYRELLKLTQEQQSELSQCAQSRTLPAGDVFRAKLILALAQGKSYSQIEAQLQTSRPTIARWKRRFEEAGIGGLDPQYKGTKPRVATAEVQAKILRRTFKRPEDGATHWTCRKMAKVAKVSKSTVQRVWRKHASSRIDWSDIWRAMIRISKRRRLKLLGCTSIHPNTRRSFA